MKLIAVCGSPRQNGNTDTALSRVAESAAKEGLETTFIPLRDYQPLGCTACMKCRETRDGRCLGRDDGMNAVFQQVHEAEALVVGSPVYFGSAAPEVLAFLQRLGYVSRGMGVNPMAGKIGAGLAVARRGGQNFTVAELEMSFGPLDMVRAGSVYWPMGFGAAPGDVADDDEAMRTMEKLGENIARLAYALND